MCKQCISRHCASMSRVVMWGAAARPATPCEGGKGQAGGSVVSRLIQVPFRRKQSVLSPCDGSVHATLPIPRNALHPAPFAPCKSANVVTDSRIPGWPHGHRRANTDAPPSHSIPFDPMLSASPSNPASVTELTDQLHLHAASDVAACLELSADPIRVLFIASTSTGD